MNKSEKHRIIWKKIIAVLCVISICFSTLVLFGCSSDKDDASGKKDKSKSTTSESLKNENPDDEDENGNENLAKVIASSVYTNFANFKVGDMDSVVELASKMKSFFGITNANLDFEKDEETKIGDKTYYSIRQTYKGETVYGCGINFVSEADGTVVAYSSKLIKTAEDADVPKMLSSDRIKDIIVEYVGKDSDVKLLWMDYEDDNIRYYVGEDYDGFAFSVPASVNGVQYAFLIGSENEGVLVADCAVNGYKVTEKNAYVYDANGKGVEAIFCRSHYDQYENRYDVIPGTEPLRWKTQSGEEVCIDSETYIFYLVSDTEKKDPLGQVAKVDDWVDLTGVTENSLDKNVSNESGAKRIEELDGKINSFFKEFLDRDGFNGNDGKVYYVYNWKDQNNEIEGAQCVTDNYHNTALLCYEGDYVEPDVFAHEYTHAVESSISHLNYSGESGSIMEAVSDVMGELFQDYCDNGELDGSDIDWKNEHRDIANPESRGYPSTYNGKHYKKNPRSVYDNSTIISHMLYSMVNGDGEKLTYEELILLIYKTLHYLKNNKDCTFEEFCETLLVAAKEMGLPEEKIERIEDCIEESGIKCDNVIDAWSPYTNVEVYDKNNNFIEQYDIIIEGTATKNNNDQKPQPLKKTISSKKANEVPLDLLEGVYTMKVVIPNDERPVLFEYSFIISENGPTRNMKVDTDFSPDQKDDETQTESKPIDPKPEEDTSGTDRETSVYLVRFKGGSGNYGYIDVRTGRVVISDKYTEADESFGDDGYAQVKDTKGNRFFINTKGKNSADIADGSAKYYYEGKYLLAFDEKNVGHIYTGITETAQIKINKSGIKSVEISQAFS